MIKSEQPKRVLCLFLVAVLILYIFYSFFEVGFHAEQSRFQTAYTFDNVLDSREDLGGNMPIPANSPISLSAGYHDFGNKGQFFLNPVLFTGRQELTLSFRMRCDANNTINGKSVFYAGTADNQEYLDIDYFAMQNCLVITYFYSGITCDAVVTLSESAQKQEWFQVTLTLGYADAKLNMAVYINGISQAVTKGSALFDSFSPNYVYFNDFSVDDIYISNVALKESDVAVLYSCDLSSFLAYEEGNSENPGSPEPWIPSEPTIPTDPIVPENPTEIIDPFAPVEEPSLPGKNPDRIVNAVTDLSWVAYTFENSFDLTNDLNSKYNASVSNVSSTAVNTEPYKGSFGKGLARRWGSYPGSVMSLDEGLLYSNNSFTFSAWVYYEPENNLSEVVQTHIGPFGETVDTSKLEKDESGNAILPPTYYRYFNKQIPSLIGSGINRIFDQTNTELDMSDCFLYDEYGKVQVQSVFYAYTEDGILLDLLNGRFLNMEGRYAAQVTFDRPIEKQVSSYISKHPEATSDEILSRLEYSVTITDMLTGLPVISPVWEKISRRSTSVITSSMFEFIGKGAIIFSPFTTDEDGNITSVLEYGASRQALTSVSIDKPTAVRSKWVHYAVTFDRTGEICVYVNGTLSKTVSTGLRLSDLKLTNLDILTGSSEAESGRFLLDEVYLSSKVLSASEIRKLRYYGINRYSTEALTDPNPESESSGRVVEEEPSEDLRPDETDELEDKYIETAVINEYIGTTFDDSTMIGRDYNGAVTAVIRNASLKQGSKTYGLALNGINSYIRYPIGILDGVGEVTISLAYNWNGVSSNGKIQKLFDFSRKVQSVESPSSYLYVSMGDGMSGVEVNLSDGKNKTVLNSGINVTNKWVRLTVTVANGEVRLYLDDALMASSPTKVNVASINPNFCYIGKSGVKGDPLFSGAVDEIYIAPSAVTEEKLAFLVKNGVEPVENEEEKTEEEDFENTLWDNIIKGILIVTGVLVLIIIIIIIISIFKK